MWPFAMHPQVPHTPLSTSSASPVLFLEGHAERRLVVSRAVEPAEPVILRFLCVGGDISGVVFSVMVWLYAEGKKV